LFYDSVVIVAACVVVVIAVFDVVGVVVVVVVVAVNVVVVLVVVVVVVVAGLLPQLCTPCLAQLYALCQLPIHLPAYLFFLSSTKKSMFSFEICFKINT